MKLLAWAGYMQSPKLAPLAKLQIGERLLSKVLHKPRTTCVPRFCTALGQRDSVIPRSKRLSFMQGLWHLGKV